MKQILIPTLLLCCPLLCANEESKDTSYWQEYAELGMLDELLTDLEAESQKGDASREQELTSVLLTYWDEIMRRRRWFDVTIYWDGVGAYGSTNYRTKDLPHEMIQQLQAYQNKPDDLSEEEMDHFIDLITWKEAYIENTPDAEKIDLIIQHIYQEEYPQATNRLAQLRQEHPDYCPQAFTELSAALAAPNRLQLLLLCTRLPLGIIRETHIVE